MATSTTSWRRSVSKKPLPLWTQEKRIWFSKSAIVRVPKSATYYSRGYGSDAVLMGAHTVQGGLVSIVVTGFDVGRFLTEHIPTVTGITRIVQRDFPIRGSIKSVTCIEVMLMDKIGEPTAEVRVFPVASDFKPTERTLQAMQVENTGGWIEIRSLLENKNGEP